MEVNVIGTSVIISCSTVTDSWKPEPNNIPSVSVQSPARIRMVYTPVSTERVAEMSPLLFSI